MQTLRSNLLPALGLGTIVLFGLSLSKLISAPYADSSAGYSTTGWFPLVHLATNALVEWKFCPVTSLFSQIGGQALAMTAMLVIGWIGLVNWLSVCEAGNSSPKGISAFIATVLWVSIGMFFGYDGVLLPTLAWFTWDLWILRRIFSKNRLQISDLTLLTLITYLLCAGSHQLAIGLVTVALFLCSLIVERIPRPSLYWVIAIQFGLAGYFLFQVPTPETNPYPLGASVVPLYGTTEGLYPRIGPELSIQTIDKQFLWGALSSLALFSALALIVLLLGGIRNSRLKTVRAVQGVAFSAIALTLVLVFETTIVPVELRQLGPLGSLSRIVPTWNYTPLAPTVFGMLLVLLATLIVLVRGQAAIFSLGVLIGGMSYTIAPQGLGVSLRVNPAREQIPVTQFAQDPRLRTPSYAVFATESRAVIERAAAVQTEHFHRAKDLVVEVNASHRPRRARKIVDGNFSTRWSSGKSRQDGDEWLLLRLARPLKVGGVKLALGNYYTDFPRAIEIRYQERCGSGATPSDDYTPIISHNPWLGVLGVTGNGLPYYGGQSDVTLIFPSVVAECLLVRQTGSSEHFEWSVSEVSLAFDEEVGTR